MSPSAHRGSCEDGFARLLGAGITPWVTLFHWDYPHALQCRGGWLSPDSPEWFARYTAT